MPQKKIIVSGILSLYTIFHLNLAYSSIEEEQRPEVIRNCYWPLLRLARKYDLPFGIEAPAYTLEAVAAIDSSSLDELRRLTTEGPCEFIGSGYAQIISPLVPAEVNAANLRIGNQVYERLLGFRPKIALVNEQAYSAGMIGHYIDAGYQAIVMEWDNPAHCHPEWDPKWRYLPQLACGRHGKEIPLIWNKSIAFQKFQRYAHGEMELDDYLDYLYGHLAENQRVFPLYGNDVEIFDFRPDRYHTEAVLREEGEWQRIGQLFECLLADGRFQFIRPAQALDLIQLPGDGNRLHLESAEQPIPVKKQGKYNLTRWAVTGRDNLGINTACWRIYEALKTKPSVNDDDWRELCYLWSSDFRTHITEKRWTVYRKRLTKFDKKISAGGAQQSPIDCVTSINSAHKPGNPLHPCAKINNNNHYLTVETDAVEIRLNSKRGLAFDGLWFKDVSDRPLIGTLSHGYYDNITLGADFYSGHLILEAPGRPKITDLNHVEPVIENNSSWVSITGAVPTPLGTVYKRICVCNDRPCVELEYRLDWKVIPMGSLRIGHITLNPAAFERATLFYRTHNGGHEWERFFLAGAKADHGKPVSFLVSASHGIGITDGVVELGDEQRSFRIEVDKTTAALIGLITYQPVGDTYFYRVALSAKEMDETSHKMHSSICDSLLYRIRIIGLI